MEFAQWFTILCPAVLRHVFTLLACQDRCWTAEYLPRHELPHANPCLLSDQVPETMQHLLITAALARDSVIDSIHWTATWVWRWLRRVVDLHDAQGAHGAMEGCSLPCHPLRIVDLSAEMLPSSTTDIAKLMSAILADARFLSGGWHEGLQITLPSTPSLWQPI